MAADLTDAAKDMALVLLSAGADVGLTRQGSEITDSGYKRQSVKVTDPDGVGPGLRAIHNVEGVSFGPWAAMAPGIVDGWFLVSPGGVVMARGDLGDRQWQPEKGDEMVFRTGELVIGLR